MSRGSCDICGTDDMPLSTVRTNRGDADACPVCQGDACQSCGGHGCEECEGTGFGHMSGKQAKVAWTDEQEDSPDDGPCPQCGASPNFSIANLDYHHVCTKCGAVYDPVYDGEGWWERNELVGQDDSMIGLYDRPHEIIERIKDTVLPRDGSVHVGAYFHPDGTPVTDDERVQLLLSSGTMSEQDILNQQGSKLGWDSLRRAADKLLYRGWLNGEYDMKHVPYEAPNKGVDPEHVEQVAEWLQEPGVYKGRDWFDRNRREGTVESKFSTNWTLDGAAIEGGFDVQADIEDEEPVEPAWYLPPSLPHSSTLKQRAGCPVCHANTRMASVGAHHFQCPECDSIFSTDRVETHEASLGPAIERIARRTESAYSLVIPDLSNDDLMEAGDLVFSRAWHPECAEHGIVGEIAVEIGNRRLSKIEGDWTLADRDYYVMNRTGGVSSGPYPDFATAHAVALLYDQTIAVPVDMLGEFGFSVQATQIPEWIDDEYSSAADFDALGEIELSIIQDEETGVWWWQAYFTEDDTEIASGESNSREQAKRSVIDAVANRGPIPPQ